jgi:hypothetical protein
LFVRTQAWVSRSFSPKFVLVARAPVSRSSNSAVRRWGAFKVAWVGGPKAGILGCAALQFPGSWQPVELATNSIVAIGQAIDRRMEGEFGEIVFM